MVQGEGFEPPKAEPDDLQSPLVDRLSIPAIHHIIPDRTSDWHIIIYYSIICSIMEEEPFSFDESKAVINMQFHHWERLQGSSVLDKIHSQASLCNDGALIERGWPIVLGSETGNFRFLFIALRMPSESILSRAHYFTVGRAMGRIILPNATLGITDEEFIEVDAMFNEAVELTKTEAPHYSLESGMLRR